MKDILFVSAQPDVPYFHWQSKLYIHNFIKNGVDPKQIHVIFGISDQTNEPTLFPQPVGEIVTKPVNLGYLLSYIHLSKLDDVLKN